MEITHPRREEYEEKFDALADLADEVSQPERPLDECRYYLCLNGENGLSVEDEFLFLEKMNDEIGGTLQKIEVKTSFWEDTVLYVP